MNFVIGIIGLVLIVLGIVIATNEEFTETPKKAIVTFILIGLILFIGSGSFDIIPTGYTGVKTTFGQISKTSLQNGFNFKIPVIQSIRKVNNKQQDIAFKDKVWSVTAENTNVFMEVIVVTYQINGEKSAWIYANVSNYKENLVSSTLVQSALKQVL
jgi:regulator of protease activity HflC (stomatin/prohibitin superfamily)